jgi:DNA-binding NarL/FixJ family response regulator
VLHQAEGLARLAVHRLRAGADRRLVDEPAARARALAEPLGLSRVLRRLEQVRGRREPPAPGHVGAPPPGSALTAREVEVLGLLAKGLLNREIAERLVISESTAANHVRSILAKTGSGNRTQAAMYAAAQGLLVGR